MSVKPLWVAALALILGGCGFSGALYIPEEEPSEQQLTQRNTPAGPAGARPQ